MLQFQKSALLALAAGLGLAVSQVAGAAIATYDLWDSNDEGPVPDGWTYGKVTIDDGGTNDNIFKFTVDVTSNPIFDSATTKLAKFGFNTLNNAPVVYQLGTFNPAAPAMTPQAGPTNFDGFGTFDWGVGIATSGAGYQSVSFEVFVNAPLGGFELFEVNSAPCVGMDCQSPSYFAAHIQNLLKNGQEVGQGSVWVGGGDDQNRPPVPLPATVWLLASGLVGLVGVARRRK